MASGTAQQSQINDEAPTVPDAWRIDFVGPAPASQWPTLYGGCFLPIRDISRTYFDEYTDTSPDAGPCNCNANRRVGLPVNLKPSDQNIAEKRRQVSKLRRKAFQCRRERRNEAGWRAEVETQVFGRLGVEVICKRCRNHLWQADWQAQPSDSVEAERLQRHRAQRQLCTCDENAREDFDLNDAGNKLMFTCRLEPNLKHEDARHIPKSIKRSKRPDRLYGLGMTRSFDVYTSRRQEITHSPIDDSREPCLYPFLIIEAKSEDQGPGFDSIERQLALPLRTCLVLQRKLKDKTGIDLNPLVWSMAFRGDEWRLYAAVPNGARIRVIDLWHGNILSEDGALQLFLIVDYLCDWAREIFRTAALRCLAGGAVLLRRYTPEASQIPTLDGQPASRRSTASPPLPNRSRYTSQSLNGDRPQTEGSDSMEIDSGVHTEIDLRSPTTERSVSVALPNQDLPEVDHIGHPALASASRIGRTCIQIRIPKDRDSLRQFLRHVLPHIGVERAAQLILDNFVNHPHVVTTDSDEVLTPMIAQSLGFDIAERQMYFPTRHIFTCRNAVDPLSGGILHSYLCVTCSQDSAVELAIVAQADGATVRSPRHWKSAVANNVEIAFRELEGVASRGQMILALERHRWILAPGVDDPNPGDVGWQTLPQWSDLVTLVEQTADGLRLDQLKALFNNAIGMGESIITAPEGRSLSPSLQEQIDTRSIDDVPGVLVKGVERPLSEGTSSCFFVFEDNNTGEGAANLLQVACRANAVYEKDSVGIWVRRNERPDV